MSLPAETAAYAAQFFALARTGDTAKLAPALEAGLPANLTNDKGDTLIMLAAYNGHAALVSLLLAHGANPNLLNDRGQSPLAGAVFKNEEEVIRALIAGGADPEWGAPTPMQTIMMFKSEDKWKTIFEEAKGRGKGAEPMPPNTGRAENGAAA